jgi:hypothetical protein
MSCSCRSRTAAAIARRCSSSSPTSWQRTRPPKQVFYPSVMTADTSDLLHEHVEEHLSMKRVLTDLLALGADDPAFLARLNVLKEQVVHHAHKEEEDKLFPKLRSALTRDERAALGNEYLVMFEDLMRSHPYKNVPSEIAAPAKLPSVSRS